jgi:hypothetical protein
MVGESRAYPEILPLGVRVVRSGELYPGHVGG